MGQKWHPRQELDLMAGKLKRLLATTQEAIKQRTCPGNVVDIATLILVHGKTEESMHAALWEAVHAWLVFRLESAYKFLHAQIQQAAYSVIRKEHRSEVHLRIGRVLLASMTADEVVEHCSMSRTSSIGAPHCWQTGTRKRR
jgi:predicted ATPase